MLFEIACQSPSGKTVTAKVTARNPKGAARKFLDQSKALKEFKNEFVSLSVKAVLTAPALEETVHASSSSPCVAEANVHSPEFPDTMGDVEETEDDEDVPPVVTSTDD